MVKKAHYIVVYQLEKDDPKLISKIMKCFFLYAVFTFAIGFAFIEPPGFNNATTALIKTFKSSFQPFGGSNFLLKAGQAL